MSIIVAGQYLKQLYVQPAMTLPSERNPANSKAFPDNSNFDVTLKRHQSIWEMPDRLRGMSTGENPAFLWVLLESKAGQEYFEST